MFTWHSFESNFLLLQQYGVSSLPALLIESRRILRAEKHFQKINKSLQQALDLQRQKPPEKL